MLGGLIFAFYEKLVNFILLTRKVQKYFPGVTEFHCLTRSDFGWWSEIQLRTGLYVSQYSYKEWDLSPNPFSLLARVSCSCNRETNGQL